MELALRLGGALREFWRGRDELHEGLYFLMQALEHNTKLVSSARAKAFNAAANLAIDLGYLDQGEVLAKAVRGSTRRWETHAGRHSPYINCRW
jgi:hypothetical protein